MKRLGIILIAVVALILVSSAALAAPLDLKPIILEDASDPNGQPGMLSPIDLDEPEPALPVQTPAPTPTPTPAATPAPTATPLPAPQVTPDGTQPPTLAESAAQPSADVNVDVAKIDALLGDMQKSPQNYKFTYDDILLTARLIYAEGKLQSNESLFAMATVIYNRYNSKKFPNSIEKIIYARNQFTVIDDPDFLTDVPPYSVFNAVIEVFLNDGATLPNDVMYFKSERQDKKWGKRVYYGTIGGNMYYA